MSRKLLAKSLLIGLPVVVFIASYVLSDMSVMMSALLGCLSTFVVCDAWYFARLMLAMLLEKLPIAHQKDLFEPSTLSGRVLLTDIDRNGHCNNARFLRECGFGRRDLWHQNGLWDILVKAGGNLVVAAQSIRYRRELSFGQSYTMETRVLGWDDRAFYVEHRFVTQVASKSGPNVRSPFVNAVVLVKNSVLGPLSPQQLVEKLPTRANNDAYSPDLRQDIVQWIDSNNTSSKLLRQEANNSK